MQLTTVWEGQQSTKCTNNCPDLCRVFAYFRPHRTDGASVRVVRLQKLYFHFSSGICVKVENVYD